MQLRLLASLEASWHNNALSFPMPGTAMRSKTPHSPNAGETRSVLVRLNQIHGFGLFRAPG
jgi:hypothetical protein